MEPTQEATPATTTSAGPTTNTAGFAENNRSLLKGILIGVLILLMLIPAAFIGELVRERAQRQQQVVHEVSSKWAEPQTITGPILIIPYLEYEPQTDGTTLARRKMAYFLPDELKINGQVFPETRHRSLYEVTLYRSDLQLEGNFPKPDFAALKIEPKDVLWNEASIGVGLNDNRGLEDQVHLQWNANQHLMEAGRINNKLLPSALSSNVSCQPENGNKFSIRMKLKGSQELYFSPLGKITSVALKSTWADPAFDGKFLPESSDITTGGFNAHWKVLQTSTPYPRAWVKDHLPLSEMAFGVKLLQPTDNYAKTERTVKYAILFIGLSFTVFFFIEMLQKRQVHPLQYLLVGIALTVFYTLLLSISEYTGFNIAYAIASLATVGLIGSYVHSIFRKAGIALGFTIALAALYGYIFFLVQLQDYALLFGSVGLFIVVALAMYCSRSIDWYQHNKK
jgi:inner membrane protein